MCCWAMATLADVRTTRVATAWKSRRCLVRRRSPGWTQEPAASAWWAPVRTLLTAFARRVLGSQMPARIERKRDAGSATGPSARSKGVAVKRSSRRCVRPFVGRMTRCRRRTSPSRERPCAPSRLACASPALDAGSVRPVGTAQAEHRVPALRDNLPAWPAWRVQFACTGPQSRLSVESGLRNDAPGLDSPSPERGVEREDVRCAAGEWANSSWFHLQ
jgi:hypothetical protein